MAKAEYRKLIEEFCAVAGISDIEGLLHRGFLLADGMSVQLGYVEAADQCRIAVDLGLIPEGLARDCHRLMLEWNFEQGEGGMQTMGIHPESGRAILTLYLPLARLGSADGLIELLDERLDPVREAWMGLLAELGMPPGLAPAIPALGQFA